MTTYTQVAYSSKENAKFTEVTAAHNRSHLHLSHMAVHHHLLHHLHYHHLHLLLLVQSFILNLRLGFSANHFLH